MPSSPTTCATSSSPRAPPGARRGRCSSIRRASARTTHGRDVVGLRTGDRYLIVNPFFHAFGLKAGILACILKGATIIPHPVFDVPAVMRRVVEERVSMLPGPPGDLPDDPQPSGPRRLRLLEPAVVGHRLGNIPVQMILDMRAKLGFQNIVTGYGLTESHGITTMCRHDDDPETIAKTAGRAIPGIEVQVVDEAGNVVPTGEQGEVVVRGYNLMKGYYDNPEATAEAIDADGWLHTGDLAFQDAAGNVTITDRIKDMFIVGGFNAYPAEIENIMMENSSVASVAIVGVPDARLGEVGMAFVVPATGADVDIDELIAWCRENMANYKVPRYVELVESLPLNASNKVLKYELAERGKQVVQS